MQPSVPNPLRAAPEHENEALLQTSGSAGSRGPPTGEARWSGEEAALGGMLAGEVAICRHRCPQDPPCFLLGWLDQACALCRDTEGLWAYVPQITEEHPGLPSSDSCRCTCSLSLSLSLFHMKREGGREDVQH